MKTVFVVRHGERHDWNDPEWGKRTPRPWDTPLSEHGKRQAEEVAAYFASLPSDRRPEAVLSSPLIRALQTAAPTARALGLKIRVEPGLTEWPVKPPLPINELTEMFGHGTIDLSHVPLLVPSEQPMEDIPMVHARGRKFVAALNSAVDSGTLPRNVALFAHAATVISVVRAAADEPELQVVAPVCGLSELRCSDAKGHRWELIQNGSSGHLAAGAEHTWSFDVWLALERERRLKKNHAAPPKS